MSCFNPHSRCLRVCVHRTASVRCSRRWRSFARVFAIASFTKGAADSDSRSTQLCATASTPRDSRQTVAAVAAGATGGGGGGPRRRRGRGVAVIALSTRRRRRARRRRRQRRATSHESPLAQRPRRLGGSRLCFGGCGLSLSRSHRCVEAVAVSVGQIAPSDSSGTSTSSPLQFCVNNQLPSA